MTDGIGLRELRHRTREVIELARTTGRVIITDHGKPIAEIIPPASPTRTKIDRALQLLDEIEPVDTGWLDELAADKRHSIAQHDRF